MDLTVLKQYSTLDDIVQAWNALKDCCIYKHTAMILYIEMLQSTANYGVTFFPVKVTILHHTIFDYIAHSIHAIHCTIKASGCNLTDRCSTVPSLSKRDAKMAGIAVHGIGVFLVRT